MISIRLISHSSSYRYEPKGPTDKDVISKLREKQKECSFNVDIMLPYFKRIREEYRPVMRHYFTEKHRTPMLWYMMRLNYARSVATTSIVGHILGLGDRHASNILMDDRTGEVVHIDLGIAFEQVCPTFTNVRVAVINSVVGEIASGPGTRTIPPHGRYGGWIRHFGHTGSLPAMC